MSKLVRHIAAWEFARFFKVRDLIVSLVLACGMVGVYEGLAWWQSQQQEPERIVAIAEDVPELGRKGLTVERLQSASLAAVRERVDSGEIDAAVVADRTKAGTASYTVIARESAGWLASLVEDLSEVERRSKIEGLGITAEQHAAAMAPAAVTFDWTETGRGGARVLALVLGITVLFTLFIGLGYLFIGITTEKQQRVTEQLFSLSSPQAIIDGKLLGIGALAFVMVLQYALVAAVGFEVFGGSTLTFLGTVGAGLSIPVAVSLLAFTVLGFALWLSLCAAVFATINDPNSSLRNTVLMLPMVPFVAVFVALDTPDGGLMIGLSHLPFTSVAAMPARLVFGNVAVWEVVLSLALLGCSVWFARRLAGRIYEAAMLIYGKEPTLSEMWRWGRGR